MKLGLPLALTLCLTTAATALSGCNIFDPLDSPTSDAQLLSAANACLDRGDFQCASDDYSKIASDIDDRQAGLAYTTLNEEGATMGVFMDAFGTGGNSLGPAMTTLANSLVDTTPGQAKRMAIYNALNTAVFNSSTAIQNSEQKAFVEFLTAAALSAEILAEGSTGGVLHKTDLATGGTSCSATGTVPSCGTAPANCAPGAGSALVDGTAFTAANGGPGTDIKSDPPNTANPTVFQLGSALSHAAEGINALTSSGSFKGISDAINTIVGAGNAACLRGALLDQGMGN